MWTEWTELDQSGHNRTNVDRIKSMWTEQTKLDQSGMNTIEWDENWTEYNFSGQNGLNRTE